MAANSGGANALHDWLAARGSVLVAFSGGVDSAYLAVKACDVLGADNVLAVLGVSEAVPGELRERARAFTARFNVPFQEIPTDELNDPGYVANRGNRCYFCKRHLWSRLVPIARATGLAAIVDGTLRDDLLEHRPGLGAGIEAGVDSPLADCGFTKAMVRDAARARGIPFWNAPASPCLASRVATGVQVTASRLAQIEGGETAVRALGIRGDLRVRHLGTAARVELPADETPFWRESAARARLAAAVAGAGFTTVQLDMSGYRRGALQNPGPACVIDITSDVATGDTPSRESA